MHDSVVIKYGSDSMEINVDDLNSMGDFVAVIATIKPQEKLDQEFVTPEDSFVKFDELTITERGMINFYVAVVDKVKSLSDNIIPMSERRLSYAAEVLGASESLKISPVDSTSYSRYCKIKLLQDLVESHYEAMLHSRLGYDLYTQVGPNGVVYVLKDLRKVFVA